jgi:gliding motility-associated-like protein
MNKSFSGNYLYYITLLVLSVVVFCIPVTTRSQGNIKAEVRNTNCLVSNHEADRWYFGQNAGLDFRPQDPVVDSTNFLLNVPTSAAVVSDSLGNVLFYTDGFNVYNRSAQLMQDGDSLHGFVGYTMPVIVIPKPGSDSIYYIFTTHRPKQNSLDPYDIYGLEYSEVNLNRNGGLGAITVKNRQLLAPEVSSKLSAVRHGNGVDYWVVAHKFNSNEFCAFAVNSNGIDTVNYSYKSSKVGIVHTGPGETNNAIGYMKISPDGTKLATAIHGSKVFEIFDFDAWNGEVKNGHSSDTIFKEAYGIEFSPDSKYLYGSTTSTSLPQPNYTPPSHLFQFDVSLGGAIFSLNNYDTIATDTNGSYFGGIQLGTDGRIYVSRSPYFNYTVSVIANPKRPGTECNFTPYFRDFNPKKSRFGFPNFIQSYFDLPHFDVENVCDEDGTVFTLQNNLNVESVSWQFGDPAANPATSTDLQPTVVFSGAGEYPVQVYEYYQGKEYGPYTETVVLNELPPVSLSDTMYLYPGSEILLDAGEGFVSYEWSTTEVSQVIKVEKPGLYTVTVQNEKCCFKIDSTQVIYFDVMVPNAFRPGGVNGEFRAYASSLDAINNFALYVYNRWGQQIWLTNDINQGWDGKINGVDAPGDVYVWLVNYDIEKSGKAVTIAYKGNVILLR